MIRRFRTCKGQGLNARCYQQIGKNGLWKKRKKKRNSTRTRSRSWSWAEINKCTTQGNKIWCLTKRSAKAQGGIVRCLTGICTIRILIKNIFKFFNFIGVYSKPFIHKHLLLEYPSNLGHCTQSRYGPISPGKTEKQKKRLRGETLWSSNAQKLAPKACYESRNICSLWWIGQKPGKLKFKIRRNILMEVVQRHRNSLLKNGVTFAAFLA